MYSVISPSSLLSSSFRASLTGTSLGSTGLTGGTWSSPDSAPYFQYLCPDREPIREKGNLKNIVVRISSDLTFTDQIDQAGPYELLCAGRNVARGWRVTFDQSEKIVYTIPDPRVYHSWSRLSTNQRPRNYLTHTHRQTDRQTENRHTGRCCSPSSACKNMDTSRFLFFNWK